MRAHTPRNTAINPISNTVDIVLFYTLHNNDINRVSFYMMVDDDTREERLKALKRYPCDICEKKFRKRRNLKRHVALHELGFDCHHCGDPKPHPSNAALAEHMNRRHSSDGPPAIIDPEWKIVKTRQTNSKRWQKNSTGYEVELCHSGHVAPTFKNFDMIFSRLLDRVVPQSEATDYVSITFESDVLDNPIISNYTSVSDLNVSTLFNIFSAQLNSQLDSGMDNFRLDSGMKVWVDRVRRLSGSGGGRRREQVVGEYGDFDTALKSKKSILRIREDGDHLSFPSAVSTAIERYKHYKTADEPNEYNLIRKAYAMKTPTGRAVERLKALARDILEAAGLTAGPCGIPEIAAIQKTLPDYQINIYNGRGGNALIYRGPKASRKLYFILDEVKRRYHVATSMKGWRRPPYVLHRCKSAYRNVRDGDIRYLSS